MQWGLDLIRENNPNSLVGHKWIIIATDYFTKWIEEMPLRSYTSHTIISFIKDNIIYRYGIPRKLVNDNGVYFTALKMMNFVINIKLS